MEKVPSKIAEKVDFQFYAQKPAKNTSFWAA
jgi:hypothetical protein